MKIKTITHKTYGTATNKAIMPVAMEQMETTFTVLKPSVLFVWLCHEIPPCFTARWLELGVKTFLNTKMESLHMQ